jgi:hypothetical protein
MTNWITIIFGTLAVLAFLASIFTRCGIDKTVFVLFVYNEDGYLDDCRVFTNASEAYNAEMAYVNYAQATGADLTPIVSEIKVNNLNPAVKKYGAGCLFNR